MHAAGHAVVRQPHNDEVALIDELSALTLAARGLVYDVSIGAGPARPEPRNGGAMKHRIAIPALLALLLVAWVGALVGCSKSAMPPPTTGAEPPPATAPAPPPAATPVPAPEPTPAAAPMPAPPPPPPMAKREPVANASPCAARDLAAFPWPNPPAPSDSALIPPYLLWPAGSEGKTLMDVARRLEGSIAAAGYLEPKYLGAGCNGFAIMLDLEQIETDGARKPSAAGFAPSTAEPGFTLSSYLKRLFYAPPGYYRQIVFVVSDQGITATTPAPTPGELRAIAKDGSAALPPGYGALPFNWKYKVVALVYEFQKGPADGDAQQIPPTGRLRAPQHLKKAQLY